MLYGDSEFGENSNTESNVNKGQKIKKNKTKKIKEIIIIIRNQNI